MARIEDFIRSNLPSTRKVDDRQEIGIGGFTAFVAINETRQLQSTSPDVVLEDRSTVTDTIFLRPVMLSIEGEVSDINIKTEVPDNIFGQAEQFLGVVTPFLPTRTVSQISKVREIIDDGLNIVRRIDSVIDSGQQILDIFGNRSDSKTNPELFLDYMDRIHFSRQLISIESPFRVYDSMRIISFETSRDNESDKITFRIQAKQIRMAELLLVEVDTPNRNPSPGLSGQSDGEVDKGISQGRDTPRSLLSVLGSTL